MLSSILVDGQHQDLLHRESGSAGSQPVVHGSSGRSRGKGFGWRGAGGAFSGWEDFGCVGAAAGQHLCPDVVLPTGSPTAAVSANIDFPVAPGLRVSNGLS